MKAIVYQKYAPPKILKSVQLLLITRMKLGRK